MRGTRIETEVEICATDVANKIKCMSTNAKGLCPLYHNCQVLIEIQDIQNVTRKRKSCPSA
jgi:hypothetical protein